MKIIALREGQGWESDTYEILTMSEYIEFTTDLDDEEGRWEFYRLGEKIE